MIRLLCGLFILYIVCFPCVFHVSAETGNFTCVSGGYYYSFDGDIDESYVTDFISGSGVCDDSQIANGGSIMVVAKSIISSVSGAHRTNHFMLVSFLISIFIISMLFLKFPYDDSVIGEKDFHQYISDLLISGNYQKLIEVASIYLDFEPEDVFVREAYAEALALSGRGLEAADVYLEISKIFENSGNAEAAQRFRSMAEKLLSEEFTA